MGIMLYSSLRVMQGLYHQPYGTLINQLIQALIYYQIGCRSDQGGFKYVLGLFEVGF